MKPFRSCSKCDKAFYASYKGKYYCSIHLKETLAKEKKLVTNEDRNEN